MFAVAIGFLISEEIVLRPVATFDAFGELCFLSIEAAIPQSRFGVITPGAGDHIDVASNVVQAITRIAGATHHLDGVQFHGKNHVHVRHVAVIAVARDAVDQQFDRIHFAFAVEAAERDFARGCALVELSQHHSWCAAEQLPTVVDRHLFKDVSTQNIN
ncbi:hypothetical protein D3C76_1009710 [compost metagenome]